MTTLRAQFAVRLLIKVGYRLYVPKRPWGFTRTLYWRKWLEAGANAQAIKQSQRYLPEPHTA
jgi:hypothetical protein